MSPEQMSELAIEVETGDLYSVVRKLHQAARIEAQPLGHYVLAKVTADMAQDWEGRPVTAEEANQFSRRFRKYALELAASVHDPDPSASVAATLNSLVRESLSKRSV